MANESSQTDTEGVRRRMGLIACLIDDAVLALEIEGLTLGRATSRNESGSEAVGLLGVGARLGSRTLGGALCVGVELLRELVDGEAMAGSTEIGRATKRGSSGRLTETTDGEGCSMVES